MRATVTIGPSRDLPGATQVTVDCQHGTTYIYVLNPDAGRNRLTTRRAVGMAVAKHMGEESCGCARGLDIRRRDWKWVN
jgi:hypothetical protein